MPTKKIKEIYFFLVIYINLKKKLRGDNQNKKGRIEKFNGDFENIYTEI